MYRHLLQGLTVLLLIFAVGCSGARRGGGGGGDDDDDHRISGLEDCGSALMDLRAGETLLPSVVKLFFSLTCDGSPVSDLTAEDFTILEDNEEISAFESDQTLVPSSLEYQMSRALVLDMSGSIIESGSLPALQEAALAFVEEVTSNQLLAVFIFDGREYIIQLVPFTDDTAVLTAAIQDLDSLDVVDPSTNLNGAVLEGLTTLDIEQSLHEGSLFAGSLIVFTDGIDQAGYVSDSEAIKAASNSDHSVYTVGLGAQVDQQHLQQVGHSGSFWANEVEDLDSAFDSLATSVLNEANSLYSLAYCSPKRAGQHELSLALNGTQASVSYSFDAENFESGCDPSDFAEGAVPDPGDDDDAPGDDDDGPADDDDAVAPPEPDPDDCNWDGHDPGWLQSTGTGVGDTIGNVSLVDRCGNDVHLWDFAGRYQTLYLVALWCGACVASAPELSAHVEDVRAALGIDYSLTVVVLDGVTQGVATAEDAEEYWNLTLGAEFPITADPQEISSAVIEAIGGGSFGIPHGILLDPQMKILGDFVHADTTAVMGLIQEDQSP